jgi:hypothetical protein
MNSAAYWDTQEGIGQLALSKRDTLVVSLVGKADHWYVRVRMHRKEEVDGEVRSVPGNQGLIIPVDRAGDLAALLQQAQARQPSHGFEQWEDIMEPES